MLGDDFMKEQLLIKIEQIEEAKDLPLPKYMSENAAGMDLYASINEDLILNKGEILLIPTGIKIAIPVGYEAQIRPRSGLALNNGIVIPNSPGTIDADYRGEIKVILMNLGKNDFVIHRGDRIAQMIINKVEIIEWEIGCLDETKRGEGGFGHTKI